MHLVPADFPRLRCIGRPFPVPHMESWRSRFRPDCRIHASCRSINETGRLRMFPYRHVSDAGSSQRTFLDIPDTDRYLCRLRSLLRLCTDRLEIYQCLFIRISLRTGSFRHSDAKPDSSNRSNPSNAFTRINDSLVLCSDRYDIWTYTHTWRSRTCRFNENYAVP